MKQNTVSSSLLKLLQKAVLTDKNPGKANMK
jgi:hypothetical protein